MSERQAKSGSYKTFAQERRGGGYIPEEGSWESALMIVKGFFSDQTLGVSDTSFWNTIEENATLTPKEAVFQYYLANTGHRSLASLLVNSFPAVRAAVELDAERRAQRKNDTDRLASHLYDMYPDKYKEHIKR